VARDGTGAVVYLKAAGGVQHVFVSALVGGVFQPPVQVDPGLPGPSTQPVIAAGNGGLLVVGFINGGTLYEVDRTGAAASLGGPVALAGGASSPSISMSNFGKAYLAFTAADGAGDDVRTAYYYNGLWALEPDPLNQTPADDAGTGSGRPEVATAGDGVAIVVWGENGHVLSRRVWGTSPSVVDEQADGPPPGCTEASADEPVVGTGGDSSYAEVAFHEVVTCGGAQQSRVLMNRLHASIYDGITQPDGLSGSTSGGADDPQITMGEYGAGWVTAGLQPSGNVVAAALGSNGIFEGTTQINSLPEAAPPDAIPATAGMFSNLIAWQQDPGSAGFPEIRARYAPSSGTLGPEMVVSSPGQGPTDAADGITAAGDVNGDVLIAWLQGEGAGAQIVTAQLYQSPGGFAPTRTFQYARTVQPSLAWTAAHDAWGPLRYVASVDGAAVAQTEGTSVQIPTQLTNGPHSWQVTATNPGGRQSASRQATVFVDTVPPLASFKLHGRSLVGSRIRMYATYADLPPSGEPRSDASGVAKVLVQWGDGTSVRLPLGFHRSFHSYRRPGRYKVSLVVTDKAGNVTRASVLVKITRAKGRTKTAPKPSATTPKAPPTKKLAHGALPAQLPNRRQGGVTATR